jgi:hypothetical protein
MAGICSSLALIAAELQLVMAHVLVTDTPQAVPLMCPRLSDSIRLWPLSKRLSHPAQNIRKHSDIHIALSFTEMAEICKDIFSILVTRCL